MPTPAIPAAIAAAVALGAPQDALRAELPPDLPWEGRSRVLALDPGEEWATPFERSGQVATPGYDETVAWLRGLCERAPELSLVSIGRSLEGRDVWMVVASAEGHADPAALREGGKPTLFVHAGIHAGEIDGKDAGMMLLRDLTVRAVEPELLADANLLFVPILNVDGHERTSAFGRANQRGPVEMGWRTNARNLNLNRDFAKLDTAGARAVVYVLRDWQPDLYLDVHVTDGADYQYDVTLGWNGRHAWSPAIAGWLDDVYRPAVHRELEQWGHVPGPLVFVRDPLDLEQGIVDWTASPRFSNGYGDLCHVPTVLVENHSLKPYDRRVLGTYVLLRASLRLLASERDALRRAVAADQERRPDPVPLAWRPGDERREMEFLGVAAEAVESPLTGLPYPRWLGEPVTRTVPVVTTDRPAAVAARPSAYWIPPTYPEVLERLGWHGVRMTRLDEPRDVEVELSRVVAHELAGAPFEGRVRVTATTARERRVVRYPAGSARVSTDQPLGDLVVALLEPDGPDSFFQWGFFHAVLQRTEYVEPYVMEPLAQRMLAADPSLRAAYEERLQNDEELADDPRARMEWLYRRTPYADDQHGLIPVGREVAP